MDGTFCLIFLSGLLPGGNCFAGIADSTPGRVKGKWSSFPEHAGVEAAEPEGRYGLAIDRVRLPADPKAKI
jgi:hypothetical protein